MAKGYDMFQSNNEDEAWVKNTMNLDYQVIETEA